MEGLLYGPQGQAASRNAIKDRIGKNQNDRKCHLCKDAEETLWPCDVY